MKKLITILLVGLSLSAIGQTTNSVITRFTKGLGVPNASTAPYGTHGYLWVDPIPNRLKVHDGTSWASLAYLSDVTGAYLPLSGGTLTGGLNGTTGVFSSTLSASNLSGNNTGDQTSVTGNAGTATALQTARTIWGQSFNGTAIVSGALSGATTIAATTSIQVPKVSMGSAPSNIANFYNTSPLTGGTTGIANWTSATINSDVTGAAYGYRSNIGTQATSFTLTSLFHNYTAQAAFGAGSTVTNQYGFYADASIIGATNNYGFYSNIPSGTGRYNIYMNGTALNYMNGALLIGGTTDNGQKLQVTGRIRVSQGLSGTAGTDSLVVHDNTSKELKLVSPTYYVPSTRTVAGFALSSNVTLASLTAGYGLSGSAYNGSGAISWTADTTSATGLVSKSRLTAYANSKAQAAALFVPINGSMTINDTKTFTNNVILKGGIIVDNATLALRDFSGTGFKVSLTPPVTVVGSDKVINIPDASGTIALTSAFESGTYTPTATLILNVSAVTMEVTHYTRIGNQVTVYGGFHDYAAASGGQTMRITLPVASNFASADDLQGHGVVNVSADENIVIKISADTTNDEALLSISATAATTSAGRFSFMYTVIP